MDVSEPALRRRPHPVRPVIGWAEYRRAWGDPAVDVSQVAPAEFPRFTTVREKFVFLRGDPVAELRLAPASVEQDAPAVYGAGTSIKSLDGRPSTSPDAVGTESGADGSVGRRRGLHRLHAQQLLHADHMDGAAAVQTARTYLAGKDRSSSVVMTDVIISELATTARTPNADETTAGMAMMDAFTAGMAMMDAFTAGMAMMDALPPGWR